MVATPFSAMHKADVVRLGSAGAKAMAVVRGEADAGEFGEGNHVGLAHGDRRQEDAKPAVARLDPKTAAAFGIREGAKTLERRLAGPSGIIFTDFVPGRDGDVLDLFTVTSAGAFWPGFATPAPKPTARSLIPPRSTRSASWPAARRSTRSSCPPSRGACPAGWRWISHTASDAPPNCP